jgi:hypothetical protein
MTLALAILGFAFWASISDAALPQNAASQPALETTNSGSSQAQQTDTTAPDAKPPAVPAASPKPANAQNHPAAKKPAHKTKAASDCGSAAGRSPASASGSSAANASSGAKDPASGPSHSAPDSGSSAPPKNCPPEKIIVRQGGTTEPSIQLAGGPGGDDASQKRDATNQMLGEAESNLKKAAAQSLTSNQKDSVTQIRQFMAESKTALAAGDVESARTLAWKARLLSEDLVKPQP